MSPREERLHFLLRRPIALLLVLRRGEDQRTSGNERPFGALVGGGQLLAWGRGSTVVCMARQFEDEAARRLKEIAAQEEAAAKERLAVRTGAARSFARAGTRLEDARAAWERAQAEATEVKAKAVVALLGTGMAVGEVAGLLRAPERELRALRAAAGRCNEKANGGEAVASVTGSRGAGEPPEAHLAS